MVSNITKYTLCLPVLALAFVTADLHACDACNLVFGGQMEGKRSGSLIAEDFRSAVQNQQNLLSGSGLGSNAFQPAPVGMQANAGGGMLETETAVVAAIAPVEPSAADQLSVSGQPSGVIAVPSGAAPLVPDVSEVSAIAPNCFGGSYSSGYGPVPEAWAADPFIEIIERDYGLSLPPTSYVPQDTVPDKSFTITLSEGKAYIGNGVVYDGFLTNGTVPGPLLIVEEGDVVEFIVKNEGTVPHGASIHSAYTQTSKYLGSISPGDKGRIVFRATQPGVFMYHCAPGGHAIPMHVMFGQYGMMVVRPKQTAYELEKRMGQKPDVEIYLVQHEFYASGKDAVEGRAMYTTFNGKLFRYVEEPVRVRPGDFVRIYFLNVGPNQVSTFHIVGILWDFAYWQGNPEMVWAGGQTVTAGPSDSWVIDFRIPPDEGAYTMLTHAVGSASRGAIGLIVAEKDIERTQLITPEGVASTPEQMAQIEAKATRTISPFAVTDYDKPQTYPAGTRSVDVSIIGNSFGPKVIEIEAGTEVTWTNEDILTYLAGEFAGIHNAVGSNGNGDYFDTPLLAHGESASHRFDEEGVYDYICAPHPYMGGRIIVKKPQTVPLATAGKSIPGSYLLVLSLAALGIALLSFLRAGRKSRD